MKTSKKLKEVFDKVRPHINGHITVINQFIEAIHDVEEMEALSQHDVSNNEVTLKAFVQEIVDECEDGAVMDTYFYKKAKSLL
jgi:hypothetical protein